MERGRVLVDHVDNPESEIVLGSRERLTVVLLPRGLNRKKKLNIYLKGDGSRAEIFGIVLGREAEDYRLEVQINHQGLNTSAYTNVRAVLFEDSQLHFSGMIKIEKGANKTLSLLENRVLILGEKAKAESLPSLEIEADDVKASHAATVGRVDASALFYLQSRGVSRQNAIALLSEGFFEPILSKITGAPLLKEVRQYLWRSLPKQSRKIISVRGR